MRGELSIGGLELDIAVRQGLAVSQYPRPDEEAAASFGTGRTKLVCNCTVVIGLNSPSCAIIATSIAVSAAARIAWPHRARRRAWTSSGVTGKRQRHLARRDGLDAQPEPLHVVGGEPVERRLQGGCIHGRSPSGDSRQRHALIISPLGLQELAMNKSLSERRRRPGRRRPRRPADGRRRLRPVRHSRGADRGAARLARQGPHRHLEQRRRRRLRPRQAARDAPDQAR